MSRMAQAVQQAVDELRKGVGRKKGQRMDEDQGEMTTEELERIRAAAGGEIEIAPDAEPAKPAEGTKMRTKKAKKATMKKAAPKAKKAPKAKAEPKPKDVASGLTAKPKNKVLFLNTDEDLALFGKLLKNATGLTEAEQFRADRLTTRLKARLG